jgi:putative transposase
MPKHVYKLRSRGVSNLHAHLVLTTKYRYKVMTLPILERLKIIIKELCEKWQCEYTEGNGEPDHFHLVFRYYPQIQLSKFIDNVKSVSSRRLNHEYDEHLRKIYQPIINPKTGKESKVFWNESYAINSVGGAKLDVLIKYVQTQPRELLEMVTRENPD